MPLAVIEVSNKGLCLTKVSLCPTQVVPFLIEDAFKALGADFRCPPP